MSTRKEYLTLGKVNELLEIKSIKREGCKKRRGNRTELGKLFRG